MLRLILPLLVLTAAFWAVIYALNRKERRTFSVHARHFILSAVLAALILLAVSGAFLIGAFING